MKKLYKLKLIALAISTTFITACGDAETNIVEKDPIVVELCLQATATKPVFMT